MGNTDKTGGWIRIHRSFLDWRFYGDALTEALFLHFLLTANWRDEPADVDGVEVGRGQTLICQRKLAALLSADEKAVRTRIRRMIAAGTIAKETLEKCVLITVLNYDRYQSDAPHAAGRTQARRAKAAEASQPGAFLPITEEEYKKNKKKEEEKNALRAVSPPAGTEPAAPEGWDEGEWNE